jgi:PAS domain S-box-containing protein
VERQSKVLVVDDDQFALRSMAKVLGGESYEVVTAASGSEAIALLRQDTFDLVLTDLKMPEVDGLEVLRRAREMAPQAPVLILTGYASLESAIEALREGAYDYLVKPCSGDELKLKIARGLERVRLAEERQRAEEALRELNASLKARTFELQVLYELSLDYEELFRLMIEHLHRAAAYDVSAALLVREDLGELFIRPTRPLSPAVQENLQERLVNAFAAMSGKSVDLGRLNIRFLERPACEGAAPPISRLGSAFQVPLIVDQGKKVVGLLFVGAEQEGAFTEVQMRLLYTVANQASLSIQRLRALLAAEHQRLESLVNNLPEGMLLLDGERRIVLANPAAREYLALLTDAGVGDVLTHLGEQSLGELFGPPPEGEFYHEVVPEGLPHRVFEVMTQPMEIAPQADNWVLVIRDITERKRAEEELKELLRKIERAKQEWESTADSLPELICLVDHLGRIIRANRTVETWNLARVVDVKGRGVHELLHPGCTGSSCYLNSFWEGAWEKATQGQPAQCEAYDEVLKRHVLVQVQPWKDWGKGTALGSTVIVVRDITERKRAEEELKEYSERLEEMVDQRTQELRDAQEQLIRAERQAAIGQVGASVCHELGNPLGVINNSVYYLKTELGDVKGKVKKHLEIMNREIAIAKKITRDLLSLTEGKEPTLQKVQINTIVRDALSRTPVTDKVVVITKLAGDLPPLMADPDQIEQVFINLILNAVQAMPDGGKLEIAAKAEETFIVTEFKDNGCGIPAENLEKLFEPLFSTKVRGIGLGLPICKKIVEAHGGNIELQSEVRKGSTFTVRLPIDRGEGE